MPRYLHNCDEAKGPWTVRKRCSICIPARKETGKKPGKSAAVKHWVCRATNKIKRTKPPPPPLPSVCSDCGVEGRVMVVLAEPDWNPEPKPEPKSESKSGSQLESSGVTDSQRIGDDVGPTNETAADFVFGPTARALKWASATAPGVPVHIMRPDEWCWSSSSSGESYDTRFRPPPLAKRILKATMNRALPCVARLTAPKPLTESERRKRSSERWNRIMRAKRRSRPWVRFQALAPGGLETIVEEQKTGRNAGIAQTEFTGSKNPAAQ
ncbi:hypothetical protein CORC01_02093 [Colletotrichum orchidophilum]|uniref:Uncharacterized protein n=1 Tax=Colletotrichum orchidophilum TaxID=1209926 RepID=A0A1G4BN17_9PEZI|nr:uncharacterized protein CORC01_02093 [Colletotrichum orchidophilum]OHF02697.1 hypothetical protein CORC01_02093 [Colletotrichum orchidophilum]